MERSHFGPVRPLPGGNGTSRVRSPESSPRASTRSSSCRATHSRRRWTREAAMREVKTGAALAPSRDSDRSVEAEPSRAGATLVPHAIARLATRALWDELALFPKPGLISLRDAGAHSDMDAST